MSVASLAVDDRVAACLDWGSGRAENFADDRAGYRHLRNETGERSPQTQIAAGLEGVVGKQGVTAVLKAWVPGEGLFFQQCGDIRGLVGDGDCRYQAT